MKSGIFGQPPGQFKGSPGDIIAKLDRVADQKDSFAKTVNVALRGTLELIIDPTPGLYTNHLDHDLDYPPAFLAFWLFNGGYHPIPSYWFTAPGALAYSLHAYTTTSTFELEFQYLAASPAGFPSSPLQVRYYLYREPAV